MQLERGRGRDVTQRVVYWLRDELGVEGVEGFAEGRGPAPSVMGRGRVISPASSTWVPMHVERRALHLEGVVSAVSVGVVGRGRIRKRVVLPQVGGPGAVGVLVQGDAIAGGKHVREGGPSAWACAPAKGCLLKKYKK